MIVRKIVVKINYTLSATTMTLDEVWQRLLLWRVSVDNLEIQPKDTSRGHFYVSIVKSAVRIAAGAALIMGAFVVTGWLIILAEILGIVEEIV